MLPQTKSKVVKRSAAILLQQIDGQKPNRARDVWHENIVQLFCQAKGRSASGHVSISQFCFCPSVWLHEIAYPPFFRTNPIPLSANAESQSNFCISGGHYDAMMAKFPYGFFLKDKRLANECPTPKKNLSCIVHIAVIHSEKER